MRNRISLASLALGLAFFAGCSTQIGGDGQLSTGEPLSVVMHVDMNAVEATTVLDIASPSGWSCRTGAVDDGNIRASGQRTTVPMTCSDGATGTMIMTWDNIQKRQHGAFKLSNGRSGKIVFDFKV